MTLIDVSHALWMMKNNGKRKGALRCTLLAAAIALIALQFVYTLILCLSFSPLPNKVEGLLRGPPTNNGNDIDRQKAASIKSTTLQDAPRIIWGIPTIKAEIDQRQAIRDTYLSFYKDEDGSAVASSSSRTPNRICSLNDIIAGRITTDECQVAYAFFMGSNMNGPTELVGKHNIKSMTVPQNPETSEVVVVVEDDIVHLNIRENQFDGKMHTWFNYGSLVARIYEFDYVAKVDSDSLVFIPTFLDYLTTKANLKRSPNNVRTYCGLPYDKNYCDPDEKDDHPCPLPLVGDVYMSGEVSMMSPDLAKFIASDLCDRKSVTISHEDVSLSNYVFLYQEPVNVVTIDKDQVLRSIVRKPFVVSGQTAQFRRKKDMFHDTLWGHSIRMSGGYFKDLNNFRRTWREFTAYYNGKSGQSLLSFVLGI